MLLEKEAELGTGGGKETPGTGVDTPRPSSPHCCTPQTRLPSPQLTLPSVVWALAKPALTPVPARPGFSCIKTGAAQLPAHSPEPPSLTRLPSPSCGPPSSLLTHQSPQSHTAPQPVLQAAQLPAHSPEPPSLTRLPSPSCSPPVGSACRPTPRPPQTSMLPCCSLEPPAVALCPCLSGDEDPEKSPTSP